MSATDNGDGATGRVGECERVLGYTFNDPETLVRALTHSSSRTAFSGSNERLEFLGDAILGAVVSLYLYAHHPEFQEGRMTKVKSQVVSRRSLALKARDIGLAPHLVVGRMFPTPKSIHHPRMMRNDHLERGGPWWLFPHRCPNISQPSKPKRKVWVPLLGVRHSCSLSPTW